MKNLTMAAVFLASITGIMSLPAGNNAGVDAQFPPWAIAQSNPQLATFLQALSQNWQALPPTTYASATPPAAGVNVGGGTGGKPGTITTTTPATGGGGVINVPAGSSITVTGENGSVGGAGAANQGNGGSITVTAGGGNGDNSITTDTTSDTDASASALGSS